jgi:trimeric autotransporter adhesin
LGVVDVTGIPKNTVVSVTVTGVDSAGSSGTSTFSFTKPFGATASVNVTLGNSALAIGGTTQASAVQLDASGQPIGGVQTTTGVKTVPLSWSSSNPNVATVSSTGVVTAVAAGTANIVATSEGINGSAPITVTGTATPASISKRAGDGTSAIVTHVVTSPRVLVTDASGVPLPNIPVTFVITGGGGTATGTNAVTGSNGEAAVGSWALGRVPGVNTMTATVQGLAPVTFTSTATASVVTMTAGLNGALGSSALLWTFHADVNGDPYRIVSVTSAVGGTSQTPVMNPGGGGALGCTTSACWVGVVDLTGLARNVVVNITITGVDSVGSSATRTISFTKPFGTTATVPVTLPNPTLVVGGTTQASAQQLDASGQPIGGVQTTTGIKTVPLTWSSSNPSVATVSSTGLVTAISVGTADIIATSEGKTGSARVTVTP